MVLNGGNFVLWGHLARLGGNFGCHTWELSTLSQLGEGELSQLSLLASRILRHLCKLKGMHLQRYMLGGLRSILQRCYGLNVVLTQTHVSKP